MAADIKETVLGVLFQPVILQGQATINTFRVVPTLTSAAGAVRSGHHVIPYVGDLVKTAKINAAVLDAAFLALTQAADAGSKTRLIIPLNSYSVVCNEGATLIVNAIKRLPKELRANIIVEIFDFPENVTMNIVEDNIIPLFPFFDHFIAVPPAEMDDFTIFANCNFMGVSINLDEVDQADELTQKKITDFWAAGTKRRLKLFFEGITDLGVKETAERYEAMGIDGPIIGEAVASI